MKNLSTKSLVFLALLIALNLVLGQFRIMLTPNNRLSIGFITTVLMALCFGPAYAGLGAAICDVLKVILIPTGGAFFPGYTLSALLGGVIYGLILYRKHLSWWRIILSRFLVIFLCNFLLNSYWLSFFSTNGQSFWAIALSRVPKYLILFPFEVILTFFVWKYVFPFIRVDLDKTISKIS